MPFKLAMLGALAAGLMACTETGSQSPRPPPPEPEVLFESGMFIGRVVPDGAVIYLALTDRQREPKSPKGWGDLIIVHQVSPSRKVVT